MPKEDYAKLCDEVNEFIANNENRTIGEQTNLFMEKYGSILELSKHKRILNIDSNIFFIKVVLIIALIATPIVLFLWFLMSI